MNSTFCARWLASSEVISQVLFTSERPKKAQMAFVGTVTLLAASYSSCVVHTETIIHLSVGESGGYLPPLRWIIVKYSSMDPRLSGQNCKFFKFLLSFNSHKRLGYKEIITTWLRGFTEDKPLYLGQRFPQWSLGAMLECLHIERDLLRP